MNPPIVSLCVPTFHRARYLASLLESLVQQLRDFPYPYELVIADNASPDDTPAVIERFAAQLPIRAHRHAHNIGGFPNWQFVMSQAQGRYIVYVSDDDSLLGAPLAEAIAAMEADPEIVVTYAPWLLYDLVANQPQGQSYEVPRDLRIERGRHAELLDHVLRHRIFPEVQIVRREALQRLQPRINPHAFFAFVHAADYLGLGAVSIRRAPFYVAITRYFADETREQLGNQEVESAWDRYRGGLEVLLARAGDAVQPEERVGLLARIQRMIAERMSVAIRMRHLNGRNPVDTHMLALRLRGLGYEKLLPVPMEQLASRAMLHFLLHDEELQRGVQQMLCVGGFDAQALAWMRQHAPCPLESVATLSSLAGLDDSLVLLAQDHPLPQADAAPRNLRVVHEADLLQRFGL